MAAIMYKDVPVWIGTGTLADFATVPLSNYVLAQNVSIQNQNSLSSNRVLTPLRSMHFDGYGIDGPLATKVSVSFVADTSGSGVINCLDILTGDVSGYIVVGNDFYGSSYLNNVSVSMVPFSPVVISAEFSCYNPEHTNEFVLIYGDYTWSGAKANAESRGGRLAVLNTAEKNVRVPQHSGSMWIGASDAGRVINDFQWVDGSLVSAGYSNWAAGQPDDAGLAEHYASRLGFAYNYAWNDLPNYFKSSDVRSSFYNPLGYILEYDKTEIVNTEASKPANISDYVQKIVYGHSVAITSGENMSETTRDSISYSVSCGRSPVYTIGSVLPQRLFLDTVEKEISIKSTNINQFINYEGYDSSISIGLRDETGKLISTIAFDKARIMSQGIVAQEGDIVSAEIKAKQVIL